MKDCREIRNNLPDFLSDSVSLQDKKEIEQHLVLCRSCQAEAAELKRTLVVLKESETSAPLESYWQNFLPRLHERLEERTESGLEYGFGQEFRPWVSRVLIPSVALIATIFILTRINFVPENHESISELRQIVQEMNVTEMQEATSPAALIPETVSRVEAVVTSDEEPSQVLSSLIAVSSDELHRFQQATLSGSNGADIEDLNDEEIETIILRLKGKGTQ